MHERVRAVEEERGSAPAQGERRGDAERRDEQRRPPDRQHLARVRFQPHLEQKNDDAYLGERRDDRVPAQPVHPRHSEERERAQEYAARQLTEHRGLSELLEQPAAQLRDQKHHGDRDEHQGIKHVRRALVPRRACRAPGKKS